jgi:general stress protein YciG
MAEDNESKGEMTAREMGRKGGNTTKARYGHDYYVAIGKRGGAEVRRILDAGKKALKNKNKED